MVDLRLNLLKHHKDVLVHAYKYGLRYADCEKMLFADKTFDLVQGDRLVLKGANGCGKSSLIKAILGNKDKLEETGELATAAGLEISYICQDTSNLHGDIHTFCLNEKLDESLFCSILRQLDMGREQFSKNMENYSEGQKKKVLIAASLLKPAHLFIWDEPLNYIDIFSRIQIENLILQYQPTMLIVEHDVQFCEKISTKTICL